MGFVLDKSLQAFRYRAGVAGFTLIELLVVIVIISIMLTMATLAINTGSAPDRLKTEAERFSALVKLAQDDSLLNSQELGIRIQPQGYAFVQMSEEGWQPVKHNNSLRERALPADMQLDLELDFEPAELRSKVTKVGDVSKVGEVNKFADSKKQIYKPQIYLLSSGEIMPSFALKFFIENTDINFDVQGVETGEVKIERHDS